MTHSCVEWMLAVSWDLTWGCWVEYQLLVSLCCLGFSQNGSWVPRGNIPWVNTPRDLGKSWKIPCDSTESYRKSLLLQSIGQVSHQGQPKLKGTRNKLDYTSENGSIALWNGMWNESCYSGNLWKIQWTMPLPSKLPLEIMVPQCVSLFQTHFPRYFPLWKPFFIFPLKWTFHMFMA